MVTFMPTLKIGRKALSQLPPVDRPTSFYDTDLTGFGLRAFPSGAHSWFIEYRPGAGGRRINKRRMVIGTAKTLTPDAARRQAANLLAKVKLGQDPALDRANIRQAETVKDLFATYLDEHVRAKKKPSTAALFEMYVDKHINPAIGNRTAIALTHDEVGKLHRKIGKTRPVTANRILSLISATYAYGIKAKFLKPSVGNPALGIEKFGEEGRERYLSEAELLRLGDAIREAETVGIEWAAQDQSKPKAKHARKSAEKRRTIIGPHAAAALRILLFTGARLREILNLRWENVDQQRGLLFLPDSKTGKKTIVLGSAALAVLEALPRVGHYVIAGNDPDKPRADLQKPWALIAKRAGLDGVRLHDLRHSFASVGAGSGLGLPIIGKLLGHANSSTTERYAHLAADPLRRASDAISAAIAKAMGEGRS